MARLVTRFHEKLVLLPVLLDLMQSLRALMQMERRSGAKIWWLSVPSRPQQSHVTNGPVAFPVQIMVAEVKFSKGERLPRPAMMVDLAQGRCDSETQVGNRLWR